jgi:choline dehydrogenase-like flavoprotein
MIVALARSLKNRFPAAKALGAAVLGAAALCCLALAACDSEPLFDTSSVPAYQKSLDAIEARLNVQDRNRLKIALRTLEVGGAVEFTQAGRPRVPASIAALEGVDDATLLLDRIRPKIEGKTAAAVIGIVVADIDAAIARAEGQLGGTDADKTLSKIVIENERYYWERNGNFEHASVQFSIYNGSAKAISHVFASGVLASRGRAAPWATGAFDYAFTPALQPGTQQQVKIFVTRGDFADSDLKRVYDAGLTLKVTNADDTTGRKFLVFNSDLIEAMRLERAVLRGS